MKPGDFIRVRNDHPDSCRAGKDGMVVEIYDEFVALFFGFDRNNHPQKCQCVGPEQWALEELDITTIT
jgi:hypothetical protein